jgi:HK97 gp10 family phage protein
MALEYGIHVEGIEELQSKLDDLDQKIKTKIVRKALKAGGAIVKAAIEERAPERPDLPSTTALPPGWMKQDVKSSFRGKTKSGNPGQIIGPGPATSHAAHLVEYGHRMVRGGKSRLDKKSGKYKGDGTETGFVPEHPFIRPAFESVQAEVTEVVSQELITGIEEAWKGR